MELTPAIQPPYESCTETELPPGYFDPPPWLVETAFEFRLIEPLRWAAKTLDPDRILAYAAAAFYRALHPTTNSTPHADEELGNALADLAVTGRVAYTMFQNLTPTEATVSTRITSGLLEFMTESIPAGVVISGLLASLPPLANNADVASAVSRALDRAYAVAWALRGPAAQQVAARTPLRWIAVSGEDDKPHRPTNIPPPLVSRTSSAYEQYEIPVVVPGRGNYPALTVQTRFFIASPPGGAPPEASSAPPRTLPLDPQPHVPAGNQVILFLHGHSSGAEESLTIIPHIHMAGLTQGTKFSIISLDLPNNGYSESFNHTRIAPSEDTTFPGGLFDHGPINTPVLDFIEDFIVAFVDTLDQITPIKNRFSGVIGGSLGGNMGLRLGRRNPLPAWLDAAIVSWSPASAWPPTVQNELMRHGPEHCRDMWNLTEADGTRADYFSEAYDRNILDVIIPYTQPQMWYRDGWEPCKTLHMKGSRLARREIYNENFRQWHFRVAGEQLIFSHVDHADHEDSSSPFRWELNKVKQLLIAGAMDDYPRVHIFTNTRILAGYMVNTPGRSLFLRDTGHSIHFERPAFLAKQIVEFFPSNTAKPELPATPMSMQITCVYRKETLSVGRKPKPGPPKLGPILSVGGINQTLSIPFQLTVRECVSFIDHGSEFFVIGADGSRTAVQIVRKAGRQPYIATVHDASPANNLLSLPEC